MNAPVEERDGHCSHGHAGYGGLQICDSLRLNLLSHKLTEAQSREFHMT